MSARLNRFVGREREIEALDALLREARLVTVTGAPGIGKTRLVDEWRARRAHSRIVSCTLAADRAPLSTVAATLGLALGEDGSDSAARIGYALDARGIELLVLDEAESVVGALAPLVPEWLTSAPRLRIVSTSRVLLRLPGERLLELAPLDASDSMALLEARAREVRPDFSRDGESEALAALVARLDGLPLALELAAARLRSLKAHDLLSRLGLDVLSGGYRNAAPRHRTLAAAFDASFELLDAPARRAWAVLSLARAPLDLASASRLLACDALAPVEALREASLLSGEPGAMSMLEPIRERGRERLAELADAPEARRRHLDWALEHRPAPRADLDEAARWALERGDHASAARCLLRIVEQSSEPPADRAARLEPLDVAALPALLEARVALARSELESQRGRSTEAAALAERALEIATEIADRDLEIDARRRLSVLAYFRGDDDRARQEAEAALAAGPDPGRAAAIEASLGVALHVRGEHAAARERYQRALVLAERAADHRTYARSLMRLGFLALDLGELDDAERYLREAHAIATRAGDDQGAALGLGYLGNVARQRGAWAEAEQTYRTVIERMRALGDRGWEAVVSMDLGILCLHRMRLDEAVTVLSAARSRAQSVGNARIEGLCEGYLAAAHACRDDPSAYRDHLERAARIAAKVDGLDEVHRVHALHARIAQIEPSELEGLHGHAELAARVVRTRQLSIAPPAHALRVSSDHARFALGAAKAVELRETGARIVAMLVQRRLDDPGAAVSTAELVRGGWPGEQMSAAAGKNRLRVAIAQLRRIGLHPLQTLRGGYRLDPEVPIAPLVPVIT